MHSEQGDYARSWLVQGLIEAGKAGNRKAFALLRGFFDWFNNASQNVYQPYLYGGISNGEQGQIASTRMYLETPVGVYMDSQVKATLAHPLILSLTLALVLVLVPERIPLSCDFHSLHLTRILPLP